MQIGEIVEVGVARDVLDLYFGDFRSNSGEMK
jgi:hypothetical protein